MDKRKEMVYTSPWVKVVQVQTEGSFAGSVVDNKGKGVTVEAASQSYEVVDGSGFSTTIGDEPLGNGNITWE